MQGPVSLLHFRDSREDASFTVAPNPMAASVATAAAQDQPPTPPHQELEWQLASPDLPAVERWLRSHPVLDDMLIEPRATLELHDTYLDTDDWRMHRAGLALRVRGESGDQEVTLKALHSRQTGVADRRELTEALPNAKRE